MTGIEGKKLLLEKDIMRTEQKIQKVQKKISILTSDNFLEKDYKNLRNIDGYSSVTAPKKIKNTASQLAERWAMLHILDNAMRLGGNAIIDLKTSTEYDETGEKIIVSVTYTGTAVKLVKNISDHGGFSLPLLLHKILTVTTPLWAMLVSSIAVIYSFYRYDMFSFKFFLMFFIVWFAVSIFIGRIMVKIPSRCPKCGGKTFPDIDYGSKNKYGKYLFWIDFTLQDDRRGTLLYPWNFWYTCEGCGHSEISNLLSSL